METNKSQDLIKDLVHITNDRISGFEKVEGAIWESYPDVKSEYDKLISSSKIMKNELINVLKNENVDVDDSGTVKGTLHGAWIDIKNSFPTGDAVNATLENVVFGEKAAIESYKDTLSEIFQVKQAICLKITFMIWKFLIISSKKCWNTARIKMMKEYNRKDFPVNEARKFLEPTPTVLLSSSYKNDRNVMTMGWYTIMEFTPSLIGCLISQANYSYELIKKSKECVINIPTSDLSKLVVDIGNCSGNEVDKFEKFDLKWIEADLVKAPVLPFCHSSFECKLYDDKLVKNYNFFIFEIVKAHVAQRPKFPKTIQYRGDSQFIESGKNIKILSQK